MLFLPLFTLLGAARVALGQQQRGTSAQTQAALGANQGALTLTSTVAGCSNIQFGAYEQLSAVPLAQAPYVAIGLSTQCVCVEVDVNAQGQVTGTRLTTATLNAISALAGTQIPGITTQLAAGAGVPSVTVYTVAQLTQLLQNEAIVVLDNNRQTSCSAASFPTGSIPNCDCSFTCQSGRVKCGNSCQVGTTCPTGMRKRDFAGDLNNLDLHCPARHTACAIPGATQFYGTNYECVNTASDLESCGGCIHPLPGRSNLGEDCTGISNALNVACVGGRCNVYSCRRGWTVAANGTACEEVHDPDFVKQAGSRYRRSPYGRERLRRNIGANAGAS